MSKPIQKIVEWDERAKKVNAAAAEAARKVATEAARKVAAEAARKFAAAPPPATPPAPPATPATPLGTPTPRHAAPPSSTRRAAITTPAIQASATRSSVMASIREAAARAEDKKTPYSIAKDAMYKNLEIEFPVEWWEHHRGGEGYKRKQPNKTLQKRQHEFNKYARENEESYRTFMGKLKDLDGYVRIVTQNMHCRDKATPPIPGMGLLFGADPNPCKAEARFEDNQSERAIEFAKLIKSGSVDAHVIAIQELQDSNSKKAFIAELRGSNYATWFPNSGIHIAEGLTDKAVDVAADVAAHPGADAAGVGAAGMLVAAAAAVEGVSRFREIPAGQGFVWDTSKVQLIQKEFLLFPTELSSGADAKAVFSSSHSFKAVAFAQFQLRSNKTNIPPVFNGSKFSVFNIHPSPYVQDDTFAEYRSKYEIDMVASHLYQFTLTANRIKEHLKANRDDYVFVCGDWNVNKYFQNGFSDKGTREDIQEIGETSAYKEIAEMIKKAENVNDAEAIEIAKFIAKKFAAKAAEKAARGAKPNISKEELEKISKDIAKAYRPLFARGYKKKQRQGKQLPEIREDEPCFRDDIPFTNKKECDFFTSGGSEYMTVSEILGTIPPTHLYSISEHDQDIPAPYGGKYTWDGLLNSVMYSPYWSGKAFQLLDHIVYSKYGKIPIYAHTMTKRYLTTRPVSATEGPLSAKCRINGSVINELPETAGHLKPYSREGHYPLVNAEPGRGVDIETTIIKYDEHQYVDVADHYGVECIAILDNKPETIHKLRDDVIPPFYQNAQFWIDPFFTSNDNNNLETLCKLAKLDKTVITRAAQGRSEAESRAKGEAERLAETIQFDKAQIPKLWELISTKQTYDKFITASGKIRCGEHIRKQDVISQIIERYIKHAAPDEIMTYLPENLNKKYILNQYVLKMANRLIEREYLNRIKFNKNRAKQIPFGEFKCARTGNVLYDCKITRKIKKAVRSASPAIITSPENLTPGRRKSIKLSRRGTFIPAPASVERRDAAAAAAADEAAIADREAEAAERRAALDEERVGIAANLTAATGNRSRLNAAGKTARRTRKLATAARERATKAAADLAAAQAAVYSDTSGIIRPKTTTRRKANVIIAPTNIEAARIKAETAAKQARNLATIAEGAEGAAIHLMDPFFINAGSNEIREAIERVRQTRRNANAAVREAGVAHAALHSVQSPSLIEKMGTYLRSLLPGGRR